MRYIFLILTYLIVFLLQGCTFPGDIPREANPPKAEDVIASLKNYPSATNVEAESSFEGNSEVTRITFQTMDSKDKVLSYYKSVLLALRFVETRRFGGFEGDKYFIIGSCPVQGVVILVDDNSEKVTIEYGSSSCI